MFTPKTTTQIQFPALLGKKIIAGKKIAVYFGIKRGGRVTISKKVRESVIVLWFQKHHPQLANDYFSSKKNFNVHAHRWANYQDYHPDQLSWPPPNFFSYGDFGHDFDDFDLGDDDGDYCDF